MHTCRVTPSQYASFWLFGIKTKSHFKAPTDKASFLTKNLIRLGSREFRTVYLNQTWLADIITLGDLYMLLIFWWLRSIDWQTILEQVKTGWKNIQIYQFSWSRGSTVFRLYSIVYFGDQFSYTYWYCMHEICNITRILNKKSQDRQKTYFILSQAELLLSCPNLFIMQTVTV